MGTVTGRDGAAPLAIDSGYCRKTTRLYPVGGRVVEIASIVATPRAWANLPESSDPAWVVREGCEPLIVADRLFA